MSKFILDKDFCAGAVDSSRESDFLRQLALAYHEIYATGLTIVGNRDDADDVIQEVCVVLWQRYDEFDPDTNFRKWAYTVTFNVAKAYARKRRRNRGFGLSDYALMKVAQMKTGGSELFELQCEVLRECMEKLPDQDREFLSSCYRNSVSLTAYARELGRSVETIYTKLKRLRRRLSECVARSLGKGD
ncbi:sigma-70 family RNA polymerase sigma factor [Planctomicrobium sp. SH661]|uniref:sigma-70 family RNA polymerase sigma factor n=1 Tax=Planctomicrobium sp. SH661 TaxID=3448124 RepID=UPI003F5B5AC7